MNEKVLHLIQLTIFVAGGITCLVTGNQQLGIMLLGAAIGNASPQNLLPMAKPASLPPFLAGNPPPSNLGSDKP